MDLELVAIGTELLLGFTLDSNGAVLGQTLAAAGIRVSRRTAVADEAGAIADAVREALDRTGMVITTGGLGPTSDDCTKEAVAALFDAPLRFDEEVWEQIAARFRRLGREPVAANRSQAEVPEGATVLPNRWGTAPGLWLEGRRGLVILLPGVPVEMARLLEAEVMPRLSARMGDAAPITSLCVRTTSIPESAVSARVGPLEMRLRPLSVAYLPSLEGVDVRLTAWELPPREGAERLEQAARLLEAELGGFVYGREAADLAAVVLNTLAGRQETLAVAESCTGGLLGARLTAVPGSSRVFLGGLICYGDEQKTALAGVPPELLATNGAVSEAVAVALARGARERTGADAAIAITGVAGPEGGSEEKPIGTVWFAWELGAQARTERVRFPGSRTEVRARAAQFALHGLLRMDQARP